jgi:hypothetical protein
VNKALLVVSAICIAALPLVAQRSSDPDKGFMTGPAGVCYRSAEKPTAAEVSSADATQVDTNGVAGLRINHNLNVMVDGFTVKTR